MTNQRLQDRNEAAGADAIAWDPGEAEANEWIVQLFAHVQTRSRVA